MTSRSEPEHAHTGVRGIGLANLLPDLSPESISQSSNHKRHPAF
jgi:hypothetical protein